MTTDSRIRRAIALGVLTLSVAVTAVPSPAEEGPAEVPVSSLNATLTALLDPAVGVTLVVPPEPAEPAEPARKVRERPRHPVAKWLPLGPDGLREKRKVRKLAKGVTLTVIRRGGKAAGPWVVRALTIDPAVAKGHLATAIGPSLAATAPTTELLRRVGALAGVNGSYFAIGTSAPGNPVGLTIADGKVLSEPSGMSRETTLLVDSKDNRLRIGSFRWHGALRNEDGRQKVRLDKVNSAPHVPRDCRDGRAFRRCEHRGQVALFTPEFGGRTPRGEGAEFVLDRAGCAVKVRTHRGVHLRRHQRSLQVSGAVAREVRSLLRKQCIEITQTLRDGKGHKIDLDRSTQALTGRFRLLRAGRVVVPDRSGAFFGRHPRTVAGTTWDGKIVLVTIDGRSERSIGATLRQAAKVARALGLRDAINLDGGGSTTMSVRGEVVNGLAAAERAVSDALVWLVAGR